MSGARAKAKERGSRPKRYRSLAAKCGKSGNLRCHEKQGTEKWKRRREGDKGAGEGQGGTEAGKPEVQKAKAKPWASSGGNEAKARRQQTQTGQEAESGTQKGRMGPGGDRKTETSGMRAEHKVRTKAMEEPRDAKEEGE